MRKPIIAGNWKMYKTRQEALEFIYHVATKVPSVDVVDSVICAPFTSLRCLVKRQGENVRIGAQNMHWVSEGAYTGEISADMLTSLKVEYVVLGHSERRAMFNETDETVNKKVLVALEKGLTPILCVGESLAEREGGTTEEVLRKQVVADFAGVSASDAAKVVIAYEPIWAIGTGRTATAEMANETCGFVRSVIAELYNNEIAEEIRIQYGGSVKPGNIDELMSQEHIDGALIGGASLDPENFVYFAEVASKHR